MISPAKGMQSTHFWSKYTANFCLNDEKSIISKNNLIWMKIINDEGLHKQNTTNPLSSNYEFKPSGFVILFKSLMTPPIAIICLLTSFIVEDCTIRSIKSAIFHQGISKETIWLIINQKLAFKTKIKVAASHAFKQCRWNQ